MVLAYALLAALCAGTIAWVFVLSWRDRNAPLAALLGVALFLCTGGSFGCPAGSVVKCEQPPPSVRP